MRYRILGPLELLDGSAPVPLTGRQRALLAVLLLHRNEVISTERLIDALWGEAPPPTAAKALHNAVSQLRRRLGNGQLRTEHGGYLLALVQDELDADVFARLVAEGRAALDAGEMHVAAERLRDGLALWRGPPLSDLTYAEFAQPEIARLEEERITTLEDRVDAELALGGGADLVAELEAEVGAPSAARAAARAADARAYERAVRPRRSRRSRTPGGHWSTSSESSPARRCASCKRARSNTIRRSTPGAGSRRPRGATGVLVASGSWPRPRRCSADQRRGGRTGRPRAGWTAGRRAARDRRGQLPRGDRPAHGVDHGDLSRGQHADEHRGRPGRSWALNADDGTLTRVAAYVHAAERFRCPTRRSTSLRGGGAWVLTGRAPASRSLAACSNSISPPAPSCAPSNSRPAGAALGSP